MSFGSETMSLVCGDSMLEGVPGGMMDGGLLSGAMVPDGMTGVDGMLSLMQGAMAWMAQMTQGGMMDGGMMSGGMGPWMLVGWIVPLLVLIGLGALAVWAIRKLAADPGAARSGRDALEVARERYARGEIDREEFRAIRSDLASG